MAVRITISSNVAGPGGCCVCVAQGHVLSLTDGSSKAAEDVVLDDVIRGPVGSAFAAKHVEEVTYDDVTYAETGRVTLSGSAPE